MKIKLAIYRQGDVLIERIADIKINKPSKPDRIVLAHGEVTGHAHEVHELDAVVHFAPEAPDSQAAGAMIMRLGRPTEVRHQEHAAIALPAGTYRVTRQVEYNPAAIRNVAD